MKNQNPIVIYENKNDKPPAGRRRTMKIKVILKEGTVKVHTLPLDLRDAEIAGWLDDNYGGYGWIKYFEI